VDIGKSEAEFFTPIFFPLKENKGAKGLPMSRKRKENSKGEQGERE